MLAPSFDELVQSSELVFRGKVTGLKSDWTGDGENRRIATWVTFAVERTLRGSVPEEVTLEFIGGEVAGRKMALAGFPSFEVGERGVFFVENRTGRVCPLMRLGHGRYRILTDSAGTERVVRDDYSILTSVDGVTAPLADKPGPQVAAREASLTLESFEDAVMAKSATTALPATTP